MKRTNWSKIRNDYVKLVNEAAEYRPGIVFLPETITPSFNLKRKKFIMLFLKQLKQ